MSKKNIILLILIILLGAFGYYMLKPSSQGDIVVEPSSIEQVPSAATQASAPVVEVSSVEPVVAEVSPETYKDTVDLAPAHLEPNGQIALDKTGKFKDYSVQFVKEYAGEGISLKLWKDGVFRTTYVYEDASSKNNHFTPSGWMGDYSDIRYTDRSTNNPQSGKTCIRVEYLNRMTQGARWAGIYWQNPPNNWGSRPGGYDLTGAKKLTFWARGEKGGERIEEFKVGGISGEYADTDSATVGPIVLTTDWQQYQIDLDGLDLSYISGGFCWVANLDGNPEGMIFYLDNIRYE